MGASILRRVKGGGIKSLSLGNGSTFTLSAFGINPSKATTSNFFMTHSNASSSCSTDPRRGSLGGCYGTPETNPPGGAPGSPCTSASMSTTKSISGGVLTYRTNCSSTKPVDKCYYIANPSKDLINLGSGQTFNIKNRTDVDYSKLTADNFVVSTYSHSGSSVPANYCCATTCYANLSVSKSYNSSTGVLSGKYNGDSNNDMGPVYLVPKLPKSA